MKPVIGSLCLVLANNLGNNGIGGFMESFSATKPCRFCMGILGDFQVKVIAAVIHVTLLVTLKYLQVSKETK
jgi:hypothetical protein